MRFARLFGFVALSTGCAQSPPARPAGVPADARWAGGPDGGHWFLCTRVVDARSPTRVDCRIYNDQTGGLYSRGEYVIQVDPDRVTGSGGMSYNSVEELLSYAGMDGDAIRLERPLELVPDGVVEYPFGDGHGKRQRFELGRHVGDETTY